MCTDLTSWTIPRDRIDNCIMAACSREAIQRSFAAAEVRTPHSMACGDGHPACTQVQTRKSLPELEAELYAARMLLLNTYPSEVCSQLMDMYSKMVLHTTKQNAAEEQSPAAQATTSTAVHADATTSAGLGPVAADPIVPNDDPNPPLPDNVPVSGWRLCFSTAAAEARFTRWLTMHSVAGDVAGLRNTLLLSLTLLLLLCLTTADTSPLLSPRARFFWPCMAWLLPSSALCVSVYIVIKRHPMWYRTNREGVCATLRSVLVLGSIVHTLTCWPAPVRTAHAPLLACFLACVIAYPSVQFAVRWQAHVLLQLVQLAMLLVATPLMFQWDSGDRLVVVLLVFVCFGFFLPGALLHSAERRLRFLFAEALARSA